MTVSSERLRAGICFSQPTGVSWMSLGDDALLGLLTAHLPYNTRLAVRDGTLVVVGTIPPVEGLDGRRAGWLGEVIGAAAASVQTGAALGNGSEAASTGELLEMARWVAAGKGWTALERKDSELRFSIPGEADLPPLILSAFDGGFLVERALPLLPARRASETVRWATAHAVLKLNGRFAFSRVVVRDPAALSLTVGNRLPPDGDEDELDYFLEAVRHDARHAMAVFECLRNDAVAVEYAIANNLPEPREQRMEV